MWFWGQKSVLFTNITVRTLPQLDGLFEDLQKRRIRGIWGTDQVWHDGCFRTLFRVTCCQSAAADARDDCWRGPKVPFFFLILKLKPKRGGIWFQCYIDVFWGFSSTYLISSIIVACPAQHDSCIFKTTIIHISNRIKQKKYKNGGRGQKCKTNIYFPGRTDERKMWLTLAATR